MFFWAQSEDMLLDRTYSTGKKVLTWPTLSEAQNYLILFQFKQAERWSEKCSERQSKNLQSSGGYLLSPEGLPSALVDLTAVFEMGTGVTLLEGPPEL